ncbi:sigma-54-dependent Fis family transcriptional regulator [bacterium]|nr:sigma-54-dependent Fis family transcriptional regulator [bacterium]
MYICIIDDNETLRQGMMEILRHEGHKVLTTADADDGLSILEKYPIDLIITDYKMDNMNGLELLKAAKKLSPDTGVIVITAYGTIELAVDAMKAGAWDFITKPFTRESLVLKVDRYNILDIERKKTQLLAGENAMLRDEIDQRLHYGEIVGESQCMRKVYQILEKAAPSDTSILIMGESGTGKELAARAIHRLSRRAKMPFVRINCGALAEGLLESELFGHEKGAFTGAIRQKKGRFELAHKGTLFLDEIGDISPSLQVKLLRVLQEKNFERVGGEETINVDVRVIAATHRNLLEAVKDGRFREDLYYRLFVVPIHLPSLRERTEDIPLLADYFLSTLSKEMGRPALRLTQAASDTLKSYAWPGNIRELANILERATVLTSGTELDRKDLIFMVDGSPGMKVAEMGMDLDGRLAAVEKEMLEEALKTTNGIKARTARLLGIKTSALYYKLDKYNLLDNKDRS